MLAACRRSQRGVRRRGLVHAMTAARRRRRVREVGAEVAAAALAARASAPARPGGRRPAAARGRARPPRSISAEQAAQAAASRTTPASRLIAGAALQGAARGRSGGRRAAGRGAGRRPRRRRRRGRRGAPNTAASSRELEASRLAPCTPVEAHFAAGVQARQRGAARGVGGDPAHVVVRRRARPGSAAARVDAGRPWQAANTAGNSSGSRSPTRLAGVEEGAACRRRSRRGWRGRRRRAAPARRRMRPAMKRSPVGVDQHRAFAAQGLGGQRRGVARRCRWRWGGTARTRGRRSRAGQRRQGQALAARSRRVGGHGIEAAEAAGGQDGARA